MKLVYWSEYDLYICFIKYINQLLLIYRRFQLTLFINFNFDKLVVLHAHIYTYKMNSIFQCYITLYYYKIIEISIHHENFPLESVG